MIVISLLFDHVPSALVNHRRYARAHGYRHVEIDMGELSGSSDNVRWMYRYELLLMHLTRAEPGELVLLLSENAAILRPAPLPALIEDRDWLLTCVESDIPQTDVQIWRNTDEVRAKLFTLLSRCRFSMELPAKEGSFLSDFDACPARHRVNDLMIVVPGVNNVENVWARWKAFAVSIRDEPQHRRFRAALIEHVNDCAARGTPLSTYLSPALPDDGPVSVVNPGQPLAIVTLYTPNIASYGRIAEANFRRYCERHGYTLYVHREIPSHLNDGKTAGNWLKPALLREYLPHHEWLFWIDADVLFNDMGRRLETIIEGRDVVFARDVGNWPFNSGIMGFRRTQPNYDAFHYLLDECAKLDDKSSVYASKGDQFYFVQQFARQPDFDAMSVSSFIEWNTPWIFRRPESFMVHYIGMWEDHKALQMDYDIRQSALE